MTNIIRPIISERSMRDTAFTKFTFHVATALNKKEIKKAVEKTFAVTVVSLTTQIVKGKTKRTGRRQMVVKQSSWKKAIVKLKDGQKINMFETGQ